EIAAAEMQNFGSSPDGVALLKQVGRVRGGGGCIVDNSGGAQSGRATNQAWRQGATLGLGGDAGDVFDAPDVHRFVEELAVGHQCLFRATALGDQATQFGSGRHRVDENLC